MMHVSSSCRHMLRAAFVATCALAQSAHGATRYDAVKQFSIKANPNGVWTYMDSAPLAYAHRNYKGVKGLDNWSDDIAYPDGASVIHNSTGGPVTLDNGTLTIPVGYLALDGEDTTPGAGVLFQAPVGGTYKVKCDILGLNTDEAHYNYLLIYLNGADLTVIRVHSNQHRHYNNTFALKAGDQLEVLASRDPRRKPHYIGIALKIEGP